MRKVVLSIMISLEGYFEGSNKEIDWHVWDEEMDIYMVDFFRTVDTIILGRVAYQLMADFWPSPASENENHIIAHQMNNLPKMCFSKTLDVSKTLWKNTIVKNEVNRDELLELKKQPGKDMVIFGGASITSTFIKMNLIDEYRLIVNPVVLGSGNQLFKAEDGHYNLKLIQSKTFACGNVLLHYLPLSK